MVPVRNLYKYAQQQQQHNSHNSANHPPCLSVQMRGTMNMKQHVKDIMQPMRAKVRGKRNIL